MVVGSVIGFLGDLKTGVMIGASLELVFMGAVQIGASTPPDSLVGTAVGTAFAIIMHADVEVALALAVPVALLVSMTSSIWLTLRTFWHPTIEKMMDKGDYKGLERMFYVVALTLYIPKALLVTFAIMAGSTVVEKMISDHSGIRHRRPGRCGRYDGCGRLRDVVKDDVVQENVRLLFPGLLIGRLSQPADSGRRLLRRHPMLFCTLRVISK